MLVVCVRIYNNVIIVCVRVVLSSLYDVCNKVDDERTDKITTMTPNSEKSTLINLF